jgi:hypothetical protein
MRHIAYFPASAKEVMSPSKNWKRLDLRAHQTENYPDVYSMIHLKSVDSRVNSPIIYWSFKTARFM